MTRRRRSRSVGRTASLVASVVLFGTAGCSGTGRGYGAAASTGSSTSVATSTTALASVTTTSVTTPAVVPTTLLPPARVGGLVSLPSIGSSPSAQVTLVQLVDPGVGTISNPVAGDRYVGVQLRVKITGTAPAQQDLNGDTMIEDSQGNLYSPIDVALQNCPALGAGRSGVGCVTFEVSAAATITDVTFTPLGQFGNVTAEWRVQ